MGPETINYLAIFSQERAFEEKVTTFLPDGASRVRSVCGHVELRRQRPVP